MARPGVTYHDIAAAANQVKAEGNNVTIENVRAILGTGSIGTINVHLRKWKEAQNTTHNIATKENLPEELIAILKGLWNKVLEQSTEIFSLAEQKYQTEITELTQEVNKYKNNNQRWQTLYNQWQQEKIKLANDNLTLEQALEFNQKENTTLNTKYDGLLQQLQDKQERIDELHRLHKQSQNNLEHYREAAREQRLLDQQQHEQQTQLHQAEIKHLKNQLIELNDKSTSLQQQYQTLQNTHFDLESNYKQIQSQHASTKTQLETSENDNVKHLNAFEHIQNQYKELQAHINEKSNFIINLQSDIKLITSQLNDTKNLLKNTQDQNKLLSHDKWSLAQEKAQLEGQLKQMQRMMTA